MNYRVFIQRLPHANWILLKIRLREGQHFVLARASLFLTNNTSAILECFFQHPERHFLKPSFLTEESFAITVDEVFEYLNAAPGNLADFSLEEVPLTKEQVDRYLSLAVLSKLNM